MTSQIRICIIGAGAAGICAAKYLSKLTPSLKALENVQTVPEFLPIVFEKGSNVGGTWIYNHTNETEESLPLGGLKNNSNQIPSSMNTGTNEDGGYSHEVHSSMYKNMYTNLPKEVMAYPDFSFPAQIERSFLHHSEVETYLKTYAKHFDIEQYIHFQTEVTMIKPVASANQKLTTWEVTTRNIRTDAFKRYEFDGIMVCNGHYSVPNCPSIPGLKDNFNGVEIHSHFYRIPEPFKDKTVAVLGAGASGVDIGLEITTAAKKVYLSHNKPKNVSELPKNMEQISGIVECVGDSRFILSDGRCIDDVDVLLYCSGYKYSFPFLDASCGIKVENSYTMVKPLYKHMININHPTMCFIGIPIQVCPFPQFDLQCQLYTNFMARIVELPSKVAMQEAFEEGLKQHIEKGRVLRHYHRMGPLQWEYNKDIAIFGKAPEIPKNVENLYNSVHERRVKYLMYYKNDRYTKELENEKSEYIRCESKNL